MRSEKIGNLLKKVRRAGKIKASEYLDSGDFPVIDQGTGEIAGYSNDAELVHREPLPVVVFGDHTRRVKFATRPFICGADGTQLLYPNDESINLTYFYYAIKNVDLSNYFYARHFKFLKDHYINIPTPETQRLIAKKLKPYDDLIENNRRRIALLEESARLLYREWFVSTKSNLLWEEGTISDLFETSSGGTPSRRNNEFYTGEINWLKTQELNGGFIFSTDEKITEDAVRSSSAKLFPRNTVIIAMYGATIGELGILAEESTTNQACCGFFPKQSQKDYLFAYCLLKHELNRLRDLGKGSAQPNLSQEIIKTLSISVPPRDLIDAFNDLIEPLFLQKKNFEQTNQKLTVARDLLLPRVMDGRVTL